MKKKLNQYLQENTEYLPSAFLIGISDITVPIKDEER
jgi:hypothetical protein